MFNSNSIDPNGEKKTNEVDQWHLMKPSHRTKGLTMTEFKDCLKVILDLNERDVDSISEEVLYPAVPVHHYRTVFMSVK